MWVLIITLLHVSDPVAGQFSPAVHSIEFLTKQSCTAAKDTFLQQFKAIDAKLNQSFKDHSVTGEGDYKKDYLIAAVCVAK